MLTQVSTIPAVHHWLCNGSSLHKWNGKYFGPVTDQAALKDHFTYNPESRMPFRDGLAEAKAQVDVLKFRSYVEPDLLDRDADTLICCSNGYLDWRTGELLPHGDDHRKRNATMMIPAVWEPNIQDEHVERFLSSSVDPAGRSILEEFAGWALLKKRQHKKLLFLLGRKDAGKSKYLSMWETMMGRENVSHKSLDQIAKDRFASVELVGRRLNIHDDISGAFLEDVSLVKSITGGGTISVQAKYKDPFDVRLFSALAFSINDMPKTSIDGAWLSRLLIVKFSKSFDGSAPDLQPDPKLEEHLTTPSAQSYFLRLAVQGLRRLEVRGRFEETRLEIDQYERDTNACIDFLKECAALSHKDVLITVQKRIPRHTFYGAFQEYCLETGRKVVGEREFAKAVRLFGAQEGNVKDRSRKRAWVGVSIMDEAWYLVERFEERERRKHDTPERWNA